MTTLGLLLSIAMPWIFGAALSRAISAGRNRLEHVALGWFIGQAAVMTTLYAMYMSGMQVTAMRAGAPIAVLAIAAVVVARRRNLDCRPWPWKPLRAAWLASPGVRIATLLIGVSLLAKVNMLVAATGWVPVRHDDAIVIWLGRAKVIAELQRMPLDAGDPLYMGGTHLDYPIFPSLLPAWTAILSGGWSEPHVAWTWPLCWLNVALLIAATLVARIRPTRALLAGYLVASLPLAFVHALRPGYVDLLLAGFLVATLAQAMAWRRHGAAPDLALALLLLLATACVKREGVFAALALLVCAVLPGLVMHRRSRGTWIVTAAAVPLMAIALGCTLPWSFIGDTLNGLGLHGDVPRILARHLFSWASFGVLWWLVPVGLIAASRRRTTNSGSSRCGAGLVVFVCLLIAYTAAIFVLSDNARFAQNDQTPSRCFLQIAPAAILALGAIIARRRRPIGSGSSLHGDV
ncbi:MAG: hypothetical protein L6Q92_14625 [Phycisphaerae bacterium]|nr:hypothetical protein [Phycisphaerae bacterium]